MNNKKGAAVFILSILLVLLVFILIFMVDHFYFSEKISSEDETSQISKTSSVKVVNPNNTIKVPGPCDNIADPFKQPDFARLKRILENYDLVKDVPKRGKILLKFYHIVGNCRKWDKTYYLSNGMVEERNVDADIELWVHTKYVENITQNNLCDIIKLARQNNDLAQSTTISDAQLLWTYKSMIKYKDCLGL